MNKIKAKRLEDKIFYSSPDKNNKIYLTKELNLPSYQTLDLKLQGDGGGWRDDNHKDCLELSK